MKDIIENLKDLRFNMSEQMMNVFLDYIIAKDNNATEEELEELRKQFIIEFRKINKENIKIYNELTEKNEE